MHLDIGGDMDSVVVRDLVKDYGKFRAVNGISFSVSPGEIFGLIGLNGAGKTTTLRIIATLLQKTGGEISVFGHRIPDESEEVRRLISYLPEDAGAYRNLTGRQYLRFMAGFFRKGSEVKAMTDRGIELTALGPRIDDKLETFSKGMTRRILLARALMVEPKLAILDEPTSGLDVLNARQIRELLKERSKDGMAILLSSHNMLEVELVCDRVGLVDKGRIIETGRPADLKEKYGARNIEEVFVQAVS
jgi:ABC-2 type transport system ATP-binding protein